MKRPNETLETAMAMAHVLAQPTAAKILMKNPHRLLPEFGRQTEQHSEPLNEIVRAMSQAILLTARAKQDAKSSNCLQHVSEDQSISNGLGRSSHASLTLRNSPSRGRHGSAISCQQWQSPDPNNPIDRQGCVGE